MKLRDVSKLLKKRESVGESPKGAKATVRRVTPVVKREIKKKVAPRQQAKKARKTTVTDKKSTTKKR